MSKLRDASIQAHRRTVVAPVSEVTAFLQEALGQKLVAYMAGISSPKTVGRWASGGQEPRTEAERRLRDAYEIFRLLMTEEGDHTVRAWFIGLNPQLDDESPARAIHEGRTRDVLAAAKAFLSGG